MLITQVELQQAGCGPVVKSKSFQWSDPGHAAVLMLPIKLIIALGYTYT